MKTSSPLRYPGGKSVMAGLLAETRRLNGLGNRAVAEPFAGGAGAALTLLFLEEAHKIYINDADPALHAFWWTLVNRPRPFLARLARTRVSMAEWRRQRDCYRCGNRDVSRFRKGFAAFFLNRCNRSGIIVNGGPIGGVKQGGEWKLSARFPKAELVRRCERVVEYRERIHVSGEDGIRFIERLDTTTTFFFIDPPYFHKGATLYLNSSDAEYHEALASRLRSMPGAAWVLTYDNCPEVRRLYRGWASVRPFRLRYAAAERRDGRELLITPRWMRLPSQQQSAAIKW